MSENNSGGCCGCSSIMIFIILITMFWLGFSYQGKHYDLDCGCNGVSLEVEE